MLPRRNFVHLSILLLLVVTGVNANAAKQIYEWTDDSGVYHVTDEFSKVPPEYRPRTTVRGASGLAASEEELARRNPSQAVRPGHKAVVLEPVESVFELPELFSTEMGTWNDGKFRELGHSSGNEGQLIYSNGTVRLEVRDYPLEKPGSRLSGFATAAKLSGGYLKDFPGEKFDRLSIVNSAVIIPSGHMVTSFSSVPAGGSSPVIVQLVAGPHGTTRLRWSGSKDEYDPLTQATLVSWRNTGKPFVLKAASLDDLNNSWVMGGVVALLVLIAAFVTGSILLIRKLQD